MTLLDRDNQEITIVSQALISNKLETVYNIEVEGFHTYHVGELGVWVHNANCCEIAQKFEHSIFNLPPGERVAVIKIEVTKISKELGFSKDSKLSKLNNRDVYKDKNGNIYSFDTQHGRWESINSKNGKHRGEVTLHSLTPIADSIDNSGKHDLKVK